MRRITLSILLSVLLLAACNMPTGPAATPTADAVATQVSQMLTQCQRRPLRSHGDQRAPHPHPPPPTATPILPTSTPTSAASATPSTSSGRGAPSWKDTLDSGKAFYQYENDNTRVVKENGHLALTGLTADGWMGWSLTFSQKPKNFSWKRSLPPDLLGE